MTIDELKTLVNDKQAGNIVAVSAADLRLLAEAHPSHPVSSVYLKAAKIRPDEYILNVDREDVRGILENKEVLRERVWIEDSEGVRVPTIQKKLGNSLSPEEAVHHSSRKAKE